MAWVKLDDGFFRNPKIVSISAESKLIYLAGLCYAGSALTDGFIPKNAVKMLASDADVSSPSRRAQELVDAGLWIENPRGYSIHDYLEHNQSAEAVRANKEAARERMKRKRSHEVRANNDGTSPEVHEPDTDTDTDTDTERTIGADAPDGTLTKMRGGKADDPKRKPLPQNGPAQQIVAAYCEAIGIEKPVSYPKAVGQAQSLVNAGITPADIPHIVGWLRQQKWVEGAVDLGLILSQAEKWLGTKSAPAQPKRLVV